MLVGMASQNSSGKCIKESDLSGLRDLQAMAKLLKPLHRIGKTRDKAGNRDLHMDQYCALILLFMFSPVVDSLRSIQRVSELRKVPIRWVLVPYDNGGTTTFFVLT